jgi:hypothetical protein
VVTNQEFLDAKEDKEKREDFIERLVAEDPFFGVHRGAVSSIGYHNPEPSNFYIIGDEGTGLVSLDFDSFWTGEKPDVRVYPRSFEDITAGFLMGGMIRGLNTFICPHEKLDDLIVSLSKPISLAEDPDTVLTYWNYGPFKRLGDAWADAKRRAKDEGYISFPSSPSPQLPPNLKKIQRLQNLTATDRQLSLAKEMDCSDAYVGYLGEMREHYDKS